MVKAHKGSRLRTSTVNTFLSANVYYCICNPSRSLKFFDLENSKAMRLLFACSPLPCYLSYFFLVLLFLLIFCQGPRHDVEFEVGQNVGFSHRSNGGRSKGLFDGPQQHQGKLMNE